MEYRDMVAGSRIWKRVDLRCFFVCAVATIATTPILAGQARQIARLVPDEATTDSSFGYSVATDGHTIIVGSQREAAYLFDAHTGDQLARLEARGRFYGTSVAIDGTTAIVGSWSGAYVYDFSDLDQIIETSLVPNDPPNTLFGVSVDVSGGTAIVGSNADEHAGQFSGAAYLFDTTTGMQVAKLTADDAQPGDNFGIRVALDDGRAVVGSVRASDSSGERPGAVYLFDAGIGEPEERQLAKYDAPSGTIGSNFGYSVDIRRDTILGAQSRGSTYVWSVNGRPARVPMSEGEHSWGHFASVSERFAVVGLPEDDRNGQQAGTTALYRFSSDELTFVEWITAEDGRPFDYFGQSVAVGGNYVVVGARIAAGGGAAYVFIVPEPSSFSLVLAVALGTCFLGRRHGQMKASGVYTRRIAGLLRA